MCTGRKPAAVAVILLGLSLSSVQAQQRIKEGDGGNPNKVAQVVGKDASEPFDDAVITYEQCMTEITSKRGVRWAIAAIGKYSAGQSLGPDGARGTADDEPGNTGTVFNTRRDVRCPTASKLTLGPGGDDSRFYGGIAVGDRATDFPTFCCDGTEVLGFRIDLNTTADPNLLSITRVVAGSDKDLTGSGISWFSSMATGQISTNGFLTGRIDDFGTFLNPNGDHTIFALDIEGLITSGVPENMPVTTYGSDSYAMLTLNFLVPPFQPFGSPMIDANDETYVMGTNFTHEFVWTDDSGSTMSSMDILPAGQTDTRGVAGFNSDYRPSGGTSRGTGVQFGKSAAGAGATDSFIIFEADDTGIGGVHYAIPLPVSLTACDVAGTTLSIGEGANYHGSAFFSGPFGTLAINANGHVAAPVDFGASAGADNGTNQALVWTDADPTSPVWGVVAFHGQEWDPVNCTTGANAWRLGLQGGVGGATFWPFSNPALDDDDNVFFSCEYDKRDVSAGGTPLTGTGLFRATADFTDPQAPCWTIDLIISEFDRWRDCNDVDVFMTGMRNTGNTWAANGAIGSNSLVGGVLQGVDPEVEPFSTAGVLFNGTTLLDEVPPFNELTEAACNDDDATCPDGTDSVIADFPVSQGTVYFIEITSQRFDGPGGTLNFSMQCQDPGNLTDLGTNGASVPPGDDCTSASVIAPGDVAFASSASTVSATLAPSDPLQECTILSEGGTGGRRNSHSVWYRYEPDVDCNLTISTCGSLPDDPGNGDPADYYDTVVAVYTGDCGRDDFDPLLNDGLLGKGRFATLAGGATSTLTVANASELSNVNLRDSVEVVSGGTTNPGFYEITAISGSQVTLVGNTGSSAGNVVWQVDDTQFFNQLLYVKPFVEPDTGPVCSNPCGDITGDGAIDLNDFLVFAGCFNEDPTLSANCMCSDMDGSLTVDLNDFLLFAGLFNVPLNTFIPPNCP